MSGAACTGPWLTATSSALSSSPQNGQRPSASELQDDIVTQSMHMIVDLGLGKWARPIAVTTHTIDAAMLAVRSAGGARRTISDRM